MLYKRPESCTSVFFTRMLESKSVKNLTEKILKHSYLKFNHAVIRKSCFEKSLVCKLKLLKLGYAKVIWNLSFTILQSNIFKNSH